MPLTPSLSNHFTNNPSVENDEQEYYKMLVEFLADDLKKAVSGTLSRRQQNAEFAMFHAHKILFRYFDPQHPEKAGGFKPNIDPVAFADEVIEGLKKVRTGPLYRGDELVQSYIKILIEERDYIQSGGMKLMDRDYRTGVPYVGGRNQERGIFSRVRPPEPKQNP